MTKTPVPRNRQPLTAERLRELLHYEPTTGVFTWRMRRAPGALKGQQAGSIRIARYDSGGGYRDIGVDGKIYLGHRLAWLYMTGSWPSVQLDHKNSVRDDNRWDNIRPATISQNGMNRPAQANNTSGFKGVTFHRKARKWMAQITKDGSLHYLGLYETREAAHEAYRKAATLLHQEFARTE
jgi:hypothetical protein